MRADAGDVRRTRPVAEECSTDAHHRGTLLDRHLEVVAHAHRQLARARARAASSRSAANQRRGRRRAGGTVMSPSTSRPRPGACRPGAATSPGAQPPFCGSSPRFTSTSTRAPGARRAISAPSAARSTDCQHVTHGASARTLLRWSCPRKCHARARSTRGALASSSWARFSPRSVTPGVDDRAHALGVDGLGRGDAA